jgi:hypothetical protein
MGRARLPRHEDGVAAPHRQRLAAVQHSGAFDHHEDREAALEHRHRRGRDPLGAEERVGGPRQQARHRRIAAGARRAQRLRVARRRLDAAQRDRPAQPQRGLGRVGDAEAIPLEQHGPVAGLLQLDDQHAFADGVRNAGGDEDDVVGRHRQHVQRPEQRRVVLLRHPALERRGLDALAKAGVDRRVGAVGGHDDPGLGLPARQVEVHAREAAVRMGVDRQALARVEQLDQQRRVAAVARGVVWTEEGDRVGRRGIAQQLSVRQPAQPQLGAAEHGGGRADPVLGHPLAGRLRASQPGDRPASAIEARHLVGREDDRLHGIAAPACEQPSLRLLMASHPRHRRNERSRLTVRAVERIVNAHR